MECWSYSTTSIIWWMECAEHLTTLQAIFNDLNMPVATEKLDGPTTRLVFLGVEIDSSEMVLRLPAQKLL